MSQNAGALGEDRSGSSPLLPLLFVAPPTVIDRDWLRTTDIDFNAWGHTSQHHKI